MRAPIVAVAHPSLLVGLVVLVVVGGVVGELRERRLRRHGFDPRRRVPDYHPAHKFSPRAATVRGLTRYERGGVGGLSRLRFDENWAQITLILQPTIWVARQDVQAVVVYRSGFRRAVRFSATDSAYDGVLFWPTRLRRTLRRLAERGWTMGGV